MHWKCINIQKLFLHSDGHCSKYHGSGSKSGQYLKAPHKAQHPMLIPTWTTSFDSRMSLAASSEPIQEPTGPEFGLCASAWTGPEPPHGISCPFEGLQEKSLLKN